MELNPIIEIHRTKHFEAEDFAEAFAKVTRLRDALAKETHARKRDVRITSLCETDIEIVEVEL